MENPSISLSVVGCLGLFRPLYIVRIASSFISTLIPVCVVSSSVVKKEEGNGNKHSVVSIGSQLGPVRLLVGTL